MSFYQRLIFLPAFLLLLFGNPGDLCAKDLDDNRQELKQIRQRIEKLSASLEKEQKKKATLQKDLAGVQKQLTRLRAREEEHASNLKSLKKDIADKEAAIRQIKDQSQQRRKLVARRLGAIYRGNQMRFLRILFANRSPVEIAEDYHYFKKVVQHDRSLLTSFRQDQEVLAGELASLETIQGRQEQEIEQLKESRETLKEGRRLKKRLLSKLKRRQGAMTVELKTLKEKSARLADLVKKLESAPTRKYTQTFGDFSRQKGRLNWPIKGRVKVPFGTGRLAGLGTLYDSQGIEIAVSGNQGIHAIWGGTVIFANNFRGFGNMIIIDHGDNFYSLYAQASRLQKKVGDSVSVGELLGYPGYEDADSVYFEIRHHGTPSIQWLG